jgi:glycosyltransferase involved in cell wall biosynthesis
LKSTKNILAFAGFYFPHVGGADTLMRELLSRMVQAGYKVDLFTCNTEKVTSHEIIDGIEVWRVPCWNMLHGTYPMPLPVPATFRILWKILMKKHDVVFTYARFFPSAFLGFLVSKLKRLPLVHGEFGSRHSFTDRKVINFISELYDHTIGSMVIGSATTLIAICHASADFLEHLGGKNIVIISPPMGLDMEVFKKTPNSLKTELGLKERIIITSVSRLIFAKGIQDLILAFPAIREKIPQATLIIVGSGPYEQELHRVAKKVGDGDIIFVGEKTTNQVAEILNITDVLVNPSYSEGLTAAPVIEAGAMGVPSITSDAGGTREIVEEGKTALIVKIGDVSAIATKVCDIIQNYELRKDIGQNISQLVHERWNWDNILPLYLKEFGALCERKRSVRIK